MNAIDQHHVSGPLETPGFANAAGAGSPVYHVRGRERIVATLSSIRQRIAPRSALVAGPYMGEFGYELQFRGFVAALARCYEKVIVISYPGTEALYPNVEFVPHDLKLEAAGYGYGRFTLEDHRRMARRLLPQIEECAYDQLIPVMTKIAVAGIPLWKASYPRLETSCSAPPTDVLFHFRALQKIGPDDRPNFAGPPAHALCRACTALGLRCAVIGHPDYSECPPDCLDLRTRDLHQTIAAICQARLVVGQQSGPTHLANHCGRGAVIWADSPARIAAGERLNPLQMRNTVVSMTTFVPPLVDIVTAIGRALEEAA